MPVRRAPFLRRVVIRDYKSIDVAAIELAPLTILVGRNGAGKSNFLDALRFVSDSLQNSLDHAVRSRGGIHEVRRRGALRSFSIQAHLDFPDQRSAVYEIVISGLAEAYGVAAESLQIYSSTGDLADSYFVKDGKVVRSSITNPPAASYDRLYLVRASSVPEFRPAYDALAAVAFYDFSPDAMRSSSSVYPRDLLSRDGANVASIVARLKEEQPQVFERITQYLAAIVPGIVEIEPLTVGPLETLRFKQMDDAGSVQEFYSWNMSDGTMRALGALIAGFQAAGQEVPMTLIGIEEPETSLHPAAIAALVGALREASAENQILITSLSPELLDQLDLETERLLAVVFQQGSSRIAPIDKASSRTIRTHLYSPGELLRMDQLEPDRQDLSRQRQISTFDKDEA